MKRIKKGSEKAKNKNLSERQKPKQKSKKIIDKKDDKPKIEITSSETLESLLHQKEEIEALLSSLEDAYNEAAILEEDYNEIKSKNEKKLEEINKKIEILTSKQKGEEKIEIEESKKPKPVAKSSKIEIPIEKTTRQPVKIVEPEIEKIEPPKKEEKPKKVKEEKTEGLPLISKDDLKNLEVELAEKIKEMVEQIGAKVTEKDLLEMKNNFVKYETEIDRLKAQIDAVKESRKVDDEKIQRIVEGLAEIRTLVYGREAAVKEQEIKFEKMMDIITKLEPEKLLLELGRRDKEINNLGMRITKLEETTKEMTEMLKRIETLLRDVGSLEHVIKISNEASQTLLSMQTIERNAQKMFDKIQGIYAELSKRMEEFMFYRAKQDRMEDLLTETMKNVDELLTKSAFFVTKEDLESFRATISVPSVQPTTGPSEEDILRQEKEEIEILLKTLEEEFKNKSISKEEYEKMKKTNLEKLKEIENKLKGGVKEKETEKITVEEKSKSTKEEKKEKPTKEEKEKTEKLLKELEDSFKKGFISKEAYEKTKKMILNKTKK